jgi:hypothetical protein
MVMNNGNTMSFNFFFSRVSLFYFRKTLEVLKELMTKVVFQVRSHDINKNSENVNVLTYSTLLNLNLLFNSGKLTTGRRVSSQLTRSHLLKTRVSDGFIQM